jgi:phage-related tail protein
MPRVEFEPKTPVLKRPKTVHALDRAVTVISDTRNDDDNNKNNNSASYTERVAVEEKPLPRIF